MHIPGYLPRPLLLANSCALPSPPFACHYVAVGDYRVRDPALAAAAAASRPLLPTVLPTARYRPPPITWCAALFLDRSRQRARQQMVALSASAFAAGAYPGRKAGEAGRLEGVRGFCCNGGRRRRTLARHPLLKSRRCRRPRPLRWANPRPPLAPCSQCRTVLYYSSVYAARTTAVTQ